MQASFNLGWRFGGLERVGAGDITGWDFGEGRREMGGAVKEGVVISGCDLIVVFFVWVQMSEEVEVCEVIGKCVLIRISGVWRVH